MLRVLVEHLRLQSVRRFVENKAFGQMEAVL